jgi:hypothetical protein
MVGLPIYISVLMVFSTLLTLYLLYKATGNSITVLWGSGIWLFVQGLVAYTGFYVADFTLPPRFGLLIGPPLLELGYLFFTNTGKRFLEGLELKALTRLHVVRIPVEICLLWLYQEKLLPVEMTFEGWNFDVFSGLSALLMLWYAFPAGAAPRRNLLLVWNVVCLILLVNIVGTAIVASPCFAQNFDFQPLNFGVFYFPFIWLPGFIVPVVLLAHLSAIRLLLKQAQ